MPIKRNLVIIPAFNEEKNIEAVIRKIKAEPSPKDILVIDDCSSDQTAVLAKRAGARVVSHVFNLGYGAAVETGFKYALANGYSFVAQMDGDGQHEPRCLSDLFRTVRSGEADVVIGSRFLENSGRYRPGLARKIGMRFFRALIRFFIRKTITDPTSGFQALNRNAIRFLVVNNLYPPDYPDADIVLLLNNIGFRVTEIPVVMYENTTGQSIHSGFKPVYYMIKMLLSIFSVLFGKYRTFFRRSKPCR